MKCNSLIKMAVAAALLPWAAAALAFDPDTPVGGPAPERFPVTLGSEAGASLNVAFAAAFGTAISPGGKAEVERVIDGQTYSFSPAALHLLPDNRAALLSIGSNADGGQADSGINAIHYLKSSAQGWVRDGEWLGRGSVGVRGNGATSWAFTGLIGKNPYLISAGGGVWQGCMVSIAVLTELTPAGPIDRGNFTDAMSSGAGIGQQDTQYDGQIIAARRDADLTIGYKGTKSLKQKYILRGGTYQLVGRDQIPGC